MQNLAPWTTRDLVRGLLPERTMVSLRASGGWGGRYNWFLSSSFFLLLLSGQVMVWVTSGICSWDVPRGGPHLGSKGLGGGLGGLGGGLWGLGPNEKCKCKCKCKCKFKC